jgi:protein-tyrosine-phosphatase
MNILFICRGNVGRSQMAEAIFNDVCSGHEVKSAGTRVVNYEGENVDGQALKDLLPGVENVFISLIERGIDVSKKARTQLTPEMIEWADRVVSMAEKERSPEYLLASPKIVFWNVADPKGLSLEEHRRIRDQIEDNVKLFIAEGKL